MADKEEKKAAKVEASEASPKQAERKYTYLGRAQSNPAIYNLYGTRKLRPWSMTDDEIDALLKVEPSLSRLWAKNG